MNFCKVKGFIVVVVVVVVCLFVVVVVVDVRCVLLYYVHFVTCKWNLCTCNCCKL